jgi:energy-converting hydrogenase A subunit R
MTAPARIFVTDCEGPLTKNDNAMEIAARFLPWGGEFFARLSRYDDYLADVARKPGYHAGDTLRLIVPFFVAFGLRDVDVKSFSAANVLLVPGAAEMMAEIQRLLPSFIISTSYTPYIRALCEVVGFSFENCRCTELSLNAWAMTDDEKTWLRDGVQRVMQRPVIEIPDGASGLDDLSERDGATVRELDRLFWSEMPAEGRMSGEIVAAVHPVGGGMKLAALEEIVAELDVRGEDVMYVGDSITDAPPFAAVREWGGVSLSFNGNAYALAAAEFAAAGADTRTTLELARAFVAGGRPAVAEAVREWADDHAAPRPPGDEPGAPALPQVGVVDEAGDGLASASSWARAHMRGEPIARLG